MVSWIGPNAPILLLVDHFGQIRDTIKSLKVNRIPELETAPWTPNEKRVNSPFKHGLLVRISNSTLVIATAWTDRELGAWNK